MLKTGHFYIVLICQTVELKNILNSHYRSETRILVLNPSVVSILPFSDLSVFSFSRTKASITPSATAAWTATPTSGGSSWTRVTPRPPANSGCLREPTAQFWRTLTVGRTESVQVRDSGLVQPWNRPPTLLLMLWTGSFPVVLELGGGRVLFFSCKGARSKSSWDIVEKS